MNTELIKIEERNGQSAVNARELHEALGSKQKFADWIKNRIDKYGFIENQDFEVFPNFMKNPSSEVFDNFINNPQGGRPTIEYILSINMAKELAMVENNQQGRKIRQYFIEVEKKARSITSPALPQTYAEALRALAEKVEEQERTSQQLALADKTIGEQQVQIESMKKKVSYLDDVLASQSTMIISAIAQDYGYSAVKFNELLHNLGIQYKLNGQWFLYAKYKDQGYVQSRTIEITRTNGKHDYKLHTEWTQKGRLFLYNFLKDNGIIPLIEKE